MHLQIGDQRFGEPLHRELRRTIGCVRNTRPDRCPEAVDDRIGHLYERFKVGPTAIYRGSGVVVVVVLAVVVWRVIVSSRTSVASSQWMTLETANDMKGLETFAEQNPNTTAGKIARLHEARVWLGPEGIETLQIKDEDRRKKGIASIEKARDAMAALANDFSDNLVLEVQCLVAVAKAEEARVGLPKEGKTDEFRGSPKKAARPTTRPPAAVRPEPRWPTT